MSRENSRSGKSGQGTFLSKSFLAFFLFLSIFPSWGFGQNLTVEPIVVSLPFHADGVIIDRSPMAYEMGIVVNATLNQQAYDLEVSINGLPSDQMFNGIVATVEFTKNGVPLGSGVLIRLQIPKNGSGSDVIVVIDNWVR